MNNCRSFFTKLTDSYVRLFRTDELFLRVLRYVVSTIEQIMLKVKSIFRLPYLSIHLSNNERLIPLSAFDSLLIEEDQDP